MSTEDITTEDVTGRTEVAPCWSSHVSKAPMFYQKDVNTTMTMWQDEQVHPNTMDQDLKTLKDNALKAYLQNQLHTQTINSLRLT